MAKQNGELERNPTVVIGARVDPKFKKILSDIAKKERRRLSNMIEVLLYEAISARKSEK